MSLPRLAVLVLLVIPSWAAAHGLTIPKDKEVMYFDAKMGWVTFNHALHATLRANSCQTCHHKHEVGGPILPCSHCHKDKQHQAEGMEGAPTAYQAFHLRCRGCHEYTTKQLGHQGGPTKCQNCHKKSKIPTNTQ